MRDIGKKSGGFLLFFALWGKYFRVLGEKLRNGRNNIDDKQMAYRQVIGNK